MSTCDCVRQDSRANCCKLKKSEEENRMFREQLGRILGFSPALAQAERIDIFKKVMDQNWQRLKDRIAELEMELKVQGEHD